MNIGGREETTEQRLARWFADGDTTVCVFENKDLGHRDLGRRIALPYSKADAEAMAIGTSRAPDSPHAGIGWRYILVGRAHSPEEVDALLKETA